MKPNTNDHIDDEIDEALRHPTVSPRQVGPRQKVELEDNFDRRELVRRLIVSHPGATADDLVRILRERQIDISSTLVHQELSRL
jgi:hypothetical protein